MSAAVDVGASVSDGVSESRHATSARALERHGMKARANKLQRIHDIVRGAQLRGAPDMTGGEIVEAYERTHGERIDPGRVAARVAELITAGRLERRAVARVCSVTGYEAKPVFVPLQQARLTA